MGDWLHRTWHSPRSGPVILVVVGLPLLFLAVMLAAFPVMAAIELIRAATTPGHLAFARTSPVYVWYGLIGWAVIVLLAVQFRRIARANRGLDVSFEVALSGGVKSAYRIAARLGKAMEQAGFEVSEVIKEDYGAGIWLEDGADPYWIAVSTDDESDEAVITLAYDPRIDLKRRLTRRADRDAFAKRAEALRAAIEADRAFTLQPG